MIRTMAARALLAASVVLFAGCASAGSTAKSQRNVITTAELVQAGDVSVYEALDKLRPQFLRSRSAVGTNAAPVRVYIGGLQMEGLDHLREIMARAVKEVRYLEPQQANARFGGNNSSGAIVVTMM